MQNLNVDVDVDVDVGTDAENNHRKVKKKSTKKDHQLMIFKIFNLLLYI